MLVSEFITAVRRQGKITSDTTDAEILATGDMEVAGRLVPLLRLTRQEYFVTEAQVASINGRCRLPTRSIMGAVRDVQLVINGRATSLPRLETEDDSLSGGSGVPGGWYFDGGSVVLLPRGTDGTVRIRYFIRPSKMVAETTTTSVARITAVVESSTDYTLTLANNSPSAAWDIVGGGSSHAMLLLEQAGVASTTQVVLKSDSLSPIAVGDYVVRSNYSPVVPLPEELHAALVHQTAYVTLRALGYDDEAASQKTLADEALSQGQVILAPRSEGNPRRRRGGIRAATGRFGGSSGWRR